MSDTRVDVTLLLAILPCGKELRRETMQPFVHHGGESSLWPPQRGWLSRLGVGLLVVLLTSCPYETAVVRNNRIATSQATQLVDDQLGVQGKALLDNHVLSSDNSQE